MMVLTPTPNFRYAQRIVEEVIGYVPQQLYKVTKGQGGTRESTQLVWLDMEHEMFEQNDTPEQCAARKEVEAAWEETKGVGVKVQRA